MLGIYNEFFFFFAPNIHGQRFYFFFLDFITSKTYNFVYIGSKSKKKKKNKPIDRELDLLVPFSLLDRIPTQATID